MGLRYKIDVLAALHAKGYTTYKLRQEKLLGEATIQKLRSGQGIAWSSIETICRLLDCQPDAIMYYDKRPEA